MTSQRCAIVLMCFMALATHAHPTPPSMLIRDDFFSGQPAASCAVNPPNLLGDNVCSYDGNRNTSVCCPAGSACVPGTVSFSMFHKPSLMYGCHRIIYSSFSALELEETLASWRWWRMAPVRYCTISSLSHSTTGLRISGWLEGEPEIVGHLVKYLITLFLGTMSAHP